MAKAQVGDLIRIIKEKRFNDEDTLDFLLGDIYEVIEVDRDGDVNFHDADGETRYINDHSSYEIHRKAGEEDAPNICACCGNQYASEYDYCGFCSEECHADYNGLEPVPDAVNSPNHYTQGRFETIEIIEEITQGYSDGYVAYCVGNALKYLARAPFKHGEPTEDIAKAGAYINFALERLQTQK